MRTVSRGLRWVERLALAGGIALLTWWAVLTVAGALGSQRALRQFAAMRSEPRPADSAAAARASGSRAAGASSASGASKVSSVPDVSGVSLATALPDLTLWSEKRVRAWRDTFQQPGPPTLAVLRMPRLGIEAAVLEGTDDWTLDRGVGHIEDTAAPGHAGNIGIAGHRDGFFRALQGVKTGDRLEMQMLDGLHVYQVARTWIVHPDDVSVLEPTSTASITLVTCYPFYFVGPAPQRFIVRAERVSTP